MNPKLVKIATFSNPIEAEQTRSLLEQQGIRAFVDGANTGTMLSYVGTALGGIRVLVSQEDVGRATELIRSLSDTADSTDGPWFCGACHEEVDAGFAVCWSCGNARSEVEQPFPKHTPAARPTPLISEEAPGRNFGMLPAEGAARDESNPYASPFDESVADTAAEDESPMVNPVAEAMLLRAWRASVIGLVFLPILLHIYSMYLLIRASLLSSHFTSAGNQRFYRALVVNLLAGGFWSLVLSRFFG